MNANKRRLVITLGSILFGSILVALDVSLVLLVVGTFAIGIVLIGITDRGTTNDVLPKPVPKNSGIGNTPAPDAKIGKREKNAKKETSPKGEGKEGKKPYRKTIIQKIRVLLRLQEKKVRVPENNAAMKIPNIDELLDSLIAEPSGVEPAPSPMLQKAPAEKEQSSPAFGIGPLKELTGAQIQEDLLSEEDEAGSGEMTDPSHDPKVTPEKMATQGKEKEESQSLSEIPETDGEHQKDEQELPVTAIQAEQLDAELKSLEPHAENKGADTGTPKMPEDMSSGTNVPAPQHAAPEASDKTPLAKEVPGPLPVPEVNDILHSLRAEVTQVRKTGNLSLLRDLKDEKVSLIALKADLESASSSLSSLKVKN
jgi:hypothetical protein